MTIDEIIQKRKTIRNFTDEVVPKEILEAILEAGRQAPFAGLAQGGRTDFRHFFIIQKESPIAEKILDLVSAARMEDLKLVDDAQFAQKYPAFCEVVHKISNKRPMDQFMAPILVIVAERAGMPAREQVALGYVLSNMWLKATDLGIGLKLCSGISDIRDTKALQQLLGLPDTETFAFDACNLGYAADHVFREETRSVPISSITYL